MAPAHFIVFEGIDGSGSTTQAELLAGWYVAQEMPVRMTGEPSSGPVGALLRLILSRRLGLSPSPGGPEPPAESRPYRPLGEGTMALLFAADRLDHLESEVEPYLAAGTTVVCDRYYLSSLAYQGVAPRLEPGWLRQINSLARVPDLTLFLDIPAAVGLERIGNHRPHYELYEAEGTLERVRENYHRLVAGLAAAGERIVTLDGTRPEAEIHAEVLIAVEDLRASAS